jgi:hypothetical protein
VQNDDAVCAVLSGDLLDAPGQAQPELRLHVLAGDIGKLLDIDLADELQAGHGRGQLGAGEGRHSAAGVRVNAHGDGAAGGDEMDAGT